LQQQLLPLSLFIPALLSSIFDFNRVYLQKTIGSR
jgi:hypothetical protein